MHMRMRTYSRSPARSSVGSYSRSQSLSNRLSMYAGAHGKLLKYGGSALGAAALLSGGAVVAHKYDKLPTFNFYRKRVPRWAGGYTPAKPAGLANQFKAGGVFSKNYRSPNTH